MSLVISLAMSPEVSLSVFVVVVIKTVLHWTV